MTIGLLAPLTGDRAANGQRISQGAQAAIDDANANGVVPGVTFRLDARDDEAKATVGADATAALVSSGAVGIVGPLNSNVAEQALKNIGGLAMISPGSTAPGMTRGNEPTVPQRQWAGFYRVTAADLIQGPVLAQYVCTTIGLGTVATLSEADWYGATVVRTFAERYAALGGQVATSLIVPKETTDYTSAAQQIIDSKVQGVVFGGLSPQGTQLRAALTAAGFTGPVIGGDEIFAEPYPDAAKDGDVTITPGVSGDLLSAEGEPRLASVLEVQSYDATAALILAVKSAGAGASPVVVRDALQNVSFAGLTGPVSFDPYGDRVVADTTVYVFRGGKWTVDAIIREPASP